MTIRNRLFGQERDGQVVNQAVKGAAAGNGGLLTVCGGSGVGKTALLEMAAMTAQGRGFTVLSAGGIFRECPRPRNTPRRRPFNAPLVATVLPMDGQILPR
jgi:ABC-type lipoprotein export system ATPase subunit